jgi:regulator of protease activity HflC (stomatin/prohibitin superfamily)
MIRTTGGVGEKEPQSSALLRLGRSHQFLGGQDMVSFTDIYLIVVALIVLSSSIKVVKEDFRLVIFRLGRFFKIAGPGLVLIIPIVDKVTRVSLSEAIPGWQTLSPEELEEKIRNFVLYKT